MPEPAAGGRRLIRFGAFEVDLRTAELRKNGRKLRLEGQPFEILRLLLECPGEITSREEIRQRLWSADTFVDYEHSINAAVKRLREVLDDSADSPRFIETLPRRGYRFICPVHSDIVKSSSAAKPLDGWPRPRIAALVVVAVTAVGLLGVIWNGTTRSPSQQIETNFYALAVLPVRNLTGDPEQEFFADSITDLLTTRLAQVKHLLIPSVTSAMYIKGARRRMPEIAKELNIEAAVEASVQRQESRIVMNVQLIDALKDRHLWARSYEFDAIEVQTVLGTIATDLLAQFPVRVSADERSRVGRSRLITPEANEAFLKGRHHLRQGTRADRIKAARYFEAVIHADPTFAPAYSSLALLHAHGGAYLAGGRLEARVKGREWATRALELDETEAEAYTALGWLELADWDWRGSEQAFRRAIDLNPSLAVARVWYSQYLGAMGRLEEARVQSATAIRLNPAAPETRTHSALSAWQAGRVEEAMAQWQQVKDLDPHYWGARHFLARGFLRQGLYAQAVSELKEAQRLEGNSTFAMLSLLAYAHARSGKRTEAQQIISDLEEGSSKQFSAYHMALAYIGLGDHDKAFASLERGYERRGEGLFFLNAEPLFEPLHADPRYASLIRRIGLPPESLPKGVKAFAQDPAGR